MAEKPEGPKPDSPEALERMQELFVKPKPGFRKLEGDEAARFHENAMRVEFFKGKIELNEARIREHQNGLEAAKLALRQAQSQHAVEVEAGRKIEESLGIKGPDDVYGQNGIIYVRVRTEEKK